MKGELENTLKSDIKWFNELSINSKEIAGEKASYLAQAYNKKNFSKNVNIPVGFVITKNAIDSFFESTNIKNAISNIFSETDKNNLEELKSASNKIKNLIMRAQFPKNIEEEISEAYENLGDDELEKGEGIAYNILSNATEPVFVAVRASYRNELGDSYFNIKGKANIIYSIKRVIASLFSSDSLLEEINSGVSPENISTAVIIQKMVQADKSGIVYSRDTITTNAIWGLGGGLKLDEVGADEYRAERSFRIIGKEIGEKKYAITRESSGALKLVGLKEEYSFMQVLEEHEVQELCNVLLRLDDIFQERTQFEFAIVDSEISIIKITSVKEKKVSVEIPITQEEIIEDPIEVIPSPIKEEVKIESKVEVINSAKGPVKEILTQTKIDVFIAKNTLGENANPTGARGGFLTLEDIIKSRGVHPSKYIDDFNTKSYGEVILNGLQMNVKNLNEVWVRLSDFTSEEFKNLDGAKERTDANPIMGLNGIRYLLANPELLKRELKAISKLKSEDIEVGVVIPKISSVYELKKVKEIIESLDIKIKVGIVLETPASIQLIKDFIEDGIDAVVFNGDTLTEYLLCVDKNNPETYKFYDDTNPALMYQLEYVIRVCNRKNVKTSFVGSATSKKEMIDYLVRKNINTIIVSPEKIAITSTMVYDAEEEFIHGTDKEKRQYEMNVEKDRQKKEILEFEKIREKEIKNKINQDSKLTKEKEEKTPALAAPLIQEVSKDIQDVSHVIENQASSASTTTYADAPQENTDREGKEEKKEFLRNSNDKDLGVTEKTQEEDVPKSESLVIHPDNMEVTSPDNVEDAMKMIDEHNNRPSELNEVELAIKGIDIHNSKDKIEDVTSDEKKSINSAILETDNNIDVLEEAKEVTTNDSLPEFNSSENTDLVSSDEELEEVPEDLGEIDGDLKKEKLAHDIELIESEKREYIEENPESEASLKNEEDFENSLDSEEEKEELEEKEEFSDNKKDVLGIF